MFGFFGRISGHGPGQGGAPAPVTPSWIAVGTADTTGTSGATPAYGTNVAGDCFVMIIAGRITSVTTPTGWTLQAGPNDQGSRKCYIFTRDTRSTGGESGTVAVTLTAASKIATIHTFRDVATSSFVEDVTNGGSASNGTTINGVDVTAGGNNRLAVLVAGTGDNHTIGSLTGETGGDWTSRATTGTTTGNNSSYSLQTAALDSGGTISGGSVSVTSPSNVDEHSVVALALKGTGV